MRVGLTGGSGFIGSHVIDHLIAAGHQVVVLDSAGVSHRSDVEIRPVDIVDLSAVTEALEGCHTAFHLAAISNVTHAYDNPTKCVEVNILGTANVLEAARLNNVDRVIFASTVWVNAAAAGEGAITEEAPINISETGHIYTSSKIAGEMLVHNYKQLYDQSFVILRYGIPYGPRMREELVIPIFVRRALEGQALTIQGDGAQYRNYVYIDDLASAHVHALKPEAENQVYNLEGPRKITIRDIAETVRSVLGSHVEIQTIAGRPGDFIGKEVSAEKARSELKWQPQVDFQDGMERYINWYRAARNSTGADLVAGAD